MKPKIVFLYKTWRNSDFARMLLLAAAWEILLFVLGLTLKAILPSFPHAEMPAGNYGLLSYTYHWDAVWFRDVTRGSYATNPFAPSYYPVFPYLALLVQHLFLNTINIVVAGFMVNFLATWLGLVALFKISQLLFENSPYVSYLVVTLYLLSPAGLFLHVFYSEAVFCALAFWAYYFALRRRWLYMAIPLSVLTATRVTSVLFIGLCALEFYRAHDWSIKRTLNRHIFAFSIVPIGFVLYACWLEHMRGGYLAMLHSYSAWTYHVFNANIVGTYFSAFGHALGGLSGQSLYPPHILFVNFWLPVLGLATLLIASLVSIFTIRRWGIPLGIFGIASCVMFTLNSNVNSVHRYLLPCLTTYLVLVFIYTKRPRFLLPLCFIIIAGFGLQIMLLTLFVKGYFAG